METILSTINEEEISRIVKFEEHNPLSILGPHIVGSDSKGKVVSIRAFLPRAVRAWVEIEDDGTRFSQKEGPSRVQMKLIDSRGFWEIQLSTQEEPLRYLLSYEDENGFVDTRNDPYSFPPMLSDYDLYLFGEGTHRKIYEKFGAQLRTINGIRGVNFSVWAPNARSVSLLGNFNHWEVGENPMSTRGSSGVWELFVPSLSETELYKFAIKSRADGRVVLKTDPMAFRTEVRPRTAAGVADLDSYSWNDENWISETNRKKDTEMPVSIYEVHLGSWKRRKQDGSYLSYAEIADELIPYVKKMGFSHIELMPVMEHPLDDSWGYQVVNYYAPTSRYGSPQDFMNFVDRCHQSGIGVILDWVPAHFPKDEYGLAMFDGTHLYEHADPRMGEHPDWGTLIFNYSRKEVRSFLISNAVFWFDRYHIDGLRLDAVASMLYLDYSRKEGEWIPNIYGGRENLDAIAFLKEANETVHSMFPNALVIAEESTAWTGVTHPVRDGGLGFDLKWNMGWMHDTLHYFSTDPIFRKHLQGTLTFSLLYAFSEKFVLVLSHDEVVHGKRSLLEKMPGDDWRKFANVRLCFGYMFTQPGKKLLFMGGEFGQRNEWYFARQLEWDESANPLNSQLSRFVRDLNELYRSKRALHELDFSYEGFEWIDFSDNEQSVISFIRKSKRGENVVIVCNMTPVPRMDYRIGVPREGFYQEILNSDAKEYGGSGVGNLGGVNSENTPFHGRPCSIKLTLPPLGILLLECNA